MEEKSYKILGISSGRVMGNTEVILRECLLECENLAKVDVRICRLRNLKIEEISGDFESLRIGEKQTNEDDFQWLKEQILWADAIIFADPSFCYMPTAEVIIMMNRALGLDDAYITACRATPKLVGLICVGGSDTVDFNLPMQYKALHAVCPGFELVDQFYGNWIRGKGYICFQEYHMERARLQAKRIVNRLKGYPVPAVKTRIMKLNPDEYKDNVFVDLEGCPVCHSAVVHMKNDIVSNGHFTCAVCGAKGAVAHHGGKLTYVWDDESVAHNRLHADFDDAHKKNFAAVHQMQVGNKSAVKEFPVITRTCDLQGDQPYVLALVAGSDNGTSELLARKALEEATADGKHQGAILRLLEQKIHFCTGCLLCKLNGYFLGGIDECVMKNDDDLWVIEKVVAASGIIMSMDAVDGFTYGRVSSFIQRFGHGSRTNHLPHPVGMMVSSYDEQVENATFMGGHMTRFYGNGAPIVAQEYFPCVPVVGDGILADESALTRAGHVGQIMREALSMIAANPMLIPMVQKHKGMCPSCGLDLIELHDDLSVSCTLCDAHGKFQHRFGENAIVWDAYDVSRSRITPEGGTLHGKHIAFSQFEELDVLKDRKIIAKQLEKYTQYDKLVSPPRTAGK